MAPYDYQLQTADLVSITRRLLLMDELGWGKTVTALATLIRTNAFPAAIIVEPHAAIQWKRDFIEKFTDFRAHIIKGRTPYALPPADVYIFKYSNVGGWTDIAAEETFNAVILDEVQQVRNGTTTLKGKACDEFVAHTDVVMGLTATPIFNYGPEMFNVMNMVNAGALGTRFEFETEWCTFHNGKSVVADPSALGAMLVDENLVQRRTYDDKTVQHNMPPLNSHLHRIDYSQKALDDIEEESRALAMRVLNAHSFHDRGMAARDLDARMRLATGVAKARHAAAYVRMLVDAGEQVLLAGWHRDVYDIWRDELADVGLVFYTGTENAKKKDAARTAFIKGDARVMAMSLRSGAGLDGLQHVCATVVFGELDWSPQVHKQLIGRVYRPGQERSVDAIYLYADTGADPAMIEVLGLKSAQAHGIVDPFAPMDARAPGHDDTRIKMLAKRVLGRE